MDWATFFQDNSQSLFTLGGVFLGSLITFLISYLNNRFQAREREKDRLEQRREAKILSKEKWIERDILKIMDLLEELINLTSEYEILEESLEALQVDKEIGFLSKDELDARFKSNYGKSQTLHEQTIKTISAITGLVLSFEEPEIIASYSRLAINIRKCLHQGSEYFEGVTKGESVGRDGGDSWDPVRESAGQLHSMLREKLISIRE